MIAQMRPRIFVMNLSLTILLIGMSVYNIAESFSLISISSAFVVLSMIVIAWFVIYIKSNTSNFASGSKQRVESRPINSYLSQENILIIAQDEQFVNQLRDVDNKYIVTSSGLDGVMLAIRCKYKAIIVEMNLPDIATLDVVQKIRNNATSDTDIHLLLAEQGNNYIIKNEAVGYLTKNINSQQITRALEQVNLSNDCADQNILLIGKNDILNKVLENKLSKDNIKVYVSKTLESAANAMRIQDFSCVISDMMVWKKSDLDIFDVLNGDVSLPRIPIIIYANSELKNWQKAQISKYTNNYIIKNGKAPHKIFKQIAKPIDIVITKPKRMDTASNNAELKSFGNRKILLVDDDKRNIFALSRVLRGRNMQVYTAEDGKQALELLDRNKDIDIILMDIMMPIMNGYQTIEKIREQQHFQDVPILAVTAKAMSSDRERCIAIGANDYLSKPIDKEQLYSVMDRCLTER